MLKTKLWLKWGERINSEIGINIYILLYIEHITNMNLLNTTGKSIKYFEIAYMGIESKKEQTYVYA